MPPCRTLGGVLLLALTVCAADVADEVDVAEELDTLQNQNGTYVIVNNQLRFKEVSDKKQPKESRSTTNGFFKSKDRKYSSSKFGATNDMKLEQLYIDVVKEERGYVAILRQAEYIARYLFDLAEAEDKELAATGITKADIELFFKRDQNEGLLHAHERLLEQIEVRERKNIREQVERVFQRISALMSNTQTPYYLSKAMSVTVSTIVWETKFQYNEAFKSLILKIVTKAPDFIKQGVKFWNGQVMKWLRRIIYQFKGEIPKTYQLKSHNAKKICDSTAMNKASLIIGSLYDKFYTRWTRTFEFVMGDMKGSVKETALQASFYRMPKVQDPLTLERIEKFQTDVMGAVNAVKIEDISAPKKMSRSNTNKEEYLYFSEIEEFSINGEWSQILLTKNALYYYAADSAETIMQVGTIAISGTSVLKWSPESNTYSVTLYSEEKTLVIETSPKNYMKFYDFLTRMLTSTILYGMEPYKELLKLDLGSRRFMIDEKLRKFAKNVKNTGKDLMSKTKEMTKKGKNNLAKKASNATKYLGMNKEED